MDRGLPDDVMGAYGVEGLAWFQNPNVRTSMDDHREEAARWKLSAKPPSSVRRARYVGTRNPPHQQGQTAGSPSDERTSEPGKTIIRHNDGPDGKSRGITETMSKANVGRGHEGTGKYHPSRRYMNPLGSRTISLNLRGKAIGRYPSKPTSSHVRACEQGIRSLQDSRTSMRTECAEMAQKRTAWTPTRPSHEQRTPIRERQNEWATQNKIEYSMSETLCQSRQAKGLAVRSTIVELRAAESPRFRDFSYPSPPFELAT
ncbi:hypothetical protein R1flu_021563 [Riccia fluitans]|uniref:Uncharacterized protein n=1 Tax=Riccia fluitans TaxID=41844 RepID=A0ABD1ZRC0_9MARC